MQNRNRRWAVTFPQKENSLKSLKSVSAIVCVAVASLMLAVSSGAQTKPSKALVIMGQNETRSYNVNGKRITIRGNNNKITWSGHTPILRVTGTGNRVYADAARVIIVSGRNNTVYWKRRYNGISPRVSRTGSGNWVMSNAGKPNR